MFVRISFKSGANPYLEYCKSMKDVKTVVSKWSENYELTPLKCTMPGKGYFFEASEKKTIMEKVKEGKSFIWEKGDE